jgi:hypothetical protein
MKIAALAFTLPLAAAFSQVSVELWPIFGIYRRVCAGSVVTAKMFWFLLGIVVPSEVWRLAPGVS